MRWSWDKYDTEQVYNFTGILMKLKLVTPIDAFFTDLKAESYEHPL